MRDISSPLDGIASPFGPQRTKTLTQLLFASSEPGFTFEPWDITTLFQDRAGTTPVTAAGQSVGLRLSKDQGLRIGGDVVLNGDFSTNSTANWTEVINGGTLNASTGQLVVNNTAGTGNTGVYQVRSCTAGMFMRVSLDVLARTEARLAIFNGTLGATIYSNNALPVGTSSFIVGPMLSGTFTVYIHCSAGNTATFDNISVRELAGNHEVAVSDAKRGVYGWMPKTGRRNLLNATDTLSTQSVTVTAVAHTLAFTGTGTVTLSGVSTAGPLVGTGAGNRVTLTFTPTAGSLTLTISGSVTLAQLQLGAADTAYQRVVSQYDITEAGVPTCYYVQADGVDDAYVTPTITPNTDKAQVFAGVRKLVDPAATSIIIEHSTVTTNPGTFGLQAARTVAGKPYAIESGGSIPYASLAVTGSAIAPNTSVIAATSDISGDLSTIRINGVQVGQSTADQGTGNYSAYPLYLYSRAGTTNPFNGLDFGHAVRFGPNLDAATIARVEALIARNTPEVTL